MNRPALPGGGSNRPNVVHMPGGSGGNGLTIGGRPELLPGGGVSRPDFSPGSRPGFQPGGNNRSNLSSMANHMGGNGNIPSNRFPGGVHPGSGTATLPGLGPSRPGAGEGGERFTPGTRPGAGGAGERFPGLVPGQGGAGDRGPGSRPGEGGAGERFPGTRPGQGGSGERFTPGHPGSIPDRHNDLAHRFDDLNNHWDDSNWHHQQWNGPNGGEINHIGYWGPNGYWGHTGAWGPNGGHWGHTGAIGPNGAWGRTIGWGPNGNVWGHGGAIGPNGAYGWAAAGGPAGHWSRNWGGWYNGYAPAWGNGRWNYLWDQYPVTMAFGATMWGLNAVNWAFGVGSYYNPYCDSPVYVNNQAVVSYTQPIVGDPVYVDSSTVSADYSAAENTPPVPADPLTDAFNSARTAFYNEQFGEALELTNQALALAPRDAAINEFRSLCLFALGQYRESAAAIHAVLAAGPGWDWTTMISLYANPETYTRQLRRLEEAVNAAPNGADLKFLTAYHYLTGDHQQEAVTLLKSVVELQPKDELAANLLKMYSPVDGQAAVENGPQPELEKPAWPIEKLQGAWTAMTSDGEFSLALEKNDEFVWKFTRDGQPQTMSGAYIIRGKNLVMQPDSGGTMLSDISLQDDHTLLFSPIGDATKLTFKK